MKPHFLAYVVLAVISAGLIVGGGCSDPSEQLDSPDAAARLRAIHDLEREDSDEAARRLTQAVQGQDVTTATEAVWALGHMQNPTASAALHDLAAGSNKRQVRNTAILALCWQVRRDRERAAEVRDLLRQSAQGDESATVRATAAGALGVVGTLDDIDFLVKVASEGTDVRVQSQGVRAIERLLGGVRFGYDSTASAEERQAVLARIQKMAPLFVQRFTAVQKGAQP